MYLFICSFDFQIILGWAGDRAWANASVIYAACMALCGGIIALVPLITDYKLLCVVSGAFGFFIAANYSLTCIILVELITLDRFTNAYGLLLLVQGLANLIGPPLGGKIGYFFKMGNILCNLTFFNLSLKMSKID